MPEETFTPSSGNVFADLGFENAEEMQLKAELVSIIGQLIEAKNIDQKSAAKILGVQQSHVSRLLRGNFEGFSIERLLRLLYRLNQSVEIRVFGAIEGKPGIRIVKATA